MRADLPSDDLAGDLGGNVFQHRDSERGRKDRMGGAPRETVEETDRNVWSNSHVETTQNGQGCGMSVAEGVLAGSRAGRRELSGQL